MSAVARFRDRTFFRKAPSSTPNAMAYVEGSNKNWRNIARRLTRVEKVARIYVPFAAGHSKLVERI